MSQADRWVPAVRRVPGWVVDVVLGLVMGGGILGRGLAESGSPAVAAAAALGAAGAGAWRRLPRTALALACGCGALVTPLGLAEPGLVAVGMAAYQVGAGYGRRGVLRTGLVAAAGLAAGVPLAERVVGADSDAGPVLLLAVLAAALAVGDSVRSRRELEDARRERERRRAVEQRLHIARELHDAVGHHIAVINVQAGVASLHLRSRPEEAEQALSDVRRAARTVLGEMTAVLSVLRDAGGGPEPAGPPVGLADLGRLLDEAAAAGLRVERTVSGEPRPLPPVVDVSAYRVIQESLTNAGRHGGGRGAVRLQLAYEPGELRIEVRNALGPARAGGQPRRVNGAGYGVAGMAERVAAAGGTLSAGPREGTEFVVLARLPTDGEETGG